MAPQEQGRYDSRQASLRRAFELRRRFDAREAGAERQMGDGVAEGSGGAGRCADGAVTLPSATLIAQSVLSGVFVGSLYGLLGLGLTLSWGILRQINLAYFALTFLAAYLCYQLSTARGIDPLATLLLIAPGFFVIGVALQWVFARFRV